MSEYKSFKYNKSMVYVKEMPLEEPVIGCMVKKEGDIFITVDNSIKTQKKRQTINELLRNKNTIQVDNYTVRIDEKWRK
ncbi:hypothetical protein ACYUJ6_02100 [Clostridium sp. JNZ X4-2]